ncbi:UbiX family flavin prenyltransferase [Sporomusa malonica]|uniref:4-hydroxy-3-polyprenylbenzoate decarboxylase n=1 Tax=Sporomusa malonica TaxID=112901 RepID=A0A1W2EW56_9FIRM|nr:UbiX family flavin prenyltransferase [Sporomusa malonica]SMD13923.1 4-hydroxy-3-polyprenylbenzoate decarboxylase [Sporomusa malonica]
MKPIVGITDATGMIYALRLLETFHKLNTQTCLIMSREAEATLIRETNCSLAHYKSLAHHFCFDDAEILPYSEWDADSMIIIPCSVDSIAPIVHDSHLNLLQKAANNILKIKKKLILVASEPVFLPDHLKILLEMAYKGATIMPYMPSFYHKPTSIDDIVNHHTGRILDLLDIEHNMVKRWGEKSE